MTDYRAYTVGNDGHFIGHRAFMCENDSDATEWAKQLVDGHDVELWSADRFVIRLVRKVEQNQPPEGYLTFFYVPHSH
jgi:hypothetical protein